MRSLAIACSAAVLALSGCGGGGDKAEGALPSPSATVTSAPKELGTITASGFGQKDEYVWVTAVVHNNSDYVGQTVTVSFNVLDGQGEILKSQSQVEAFVRPGEDHLLGTQVSLEPGQQAAKVEAALDVEADGTFSDQPFPQIPTTPAKVVAAGGGHHAVFDLTNPLTDALKSPRIQVACTDAHGAINGGGADYPELVPAGGKVKVEVSLILSGESKDCTVFVGSPSDWDGGTSAAATPSGSATPSASATASAQAPAGSAEDAFKAWITQFGKRDWKAQYKTLVNAQRKLVSQGEFIACRSADDPPKVAWVKALSATDTGKTSIPGTKASLPATKVNAQVKADGITVPVDAHMYREDGMWKWSLEKDALAKCAG